MDGDYTPEELFRGCLPKSCIDCRRSTKEGAIDAHSDNYYCYRCLNLDSKTAPMERVIHPDRCSGGMLAALTQQIRRCYRTYQNSGGYRSMAKKDMVDESNGGKSADFYYNFPMENLPYLLPRTRLDDPLLVQTRDDFYADLAGSFSTFMSIDPALRQPTKTAGGEFITPRVIVTSRSRSRSRSRPHVPRARTEQDVKFINDNASGALNKDSTLERDRERRAARMNKWACEPVDDGPGMMSNQPSQSSTAAGPIPRQVESANIASKPKQANMVKCRQCDEWGHFARDCPQGIVCHRCGQPGHMARHCTRPAGMISSFAEETPTIPGKLHLGQIEDFRIAKANRHIKAMRQRDQQRIEAQQMGLVCNICGKPGHIARECTLAHRVAR